MLNLVNWRQRARRARVIWLLKWGMGLLLAVCSVALSSWFTLTQLERQRPKQTETLAQLETQWRDAVETRDRLMNRIDTLERTQQAVNERQADMQKRWSHIFDLVTIAPMRLLAVEFTPERTTARIQVADPQVLHRDLPSRTAIRAMRPLQFGFEATLDTRHEP